MERDDGMLKEFREFAMRGNVVDLAVGVIIGAAFGKVVNSLVNDVLMPPIGLLVGQVDFSELFIDLSRSGAASLEAARSTGAATLNYGLFINNVLDFIIVAFAVFILVRKMNQLRRLQDRGKVAEPATTRSCPYCVSTIPVKATRCPACTSDLAEGRGTAGA